MRTRDKNSGSEVIVAWVFKLQAQIIIVPAGYLFRL